MRELTEDETNIVSGGLSTAEGLNAQLAIGAGALAFGMTGVGTLAFAAAGAIMAIDMWVTYKLR